jgi:hypothetical protein
MEPRGCNPWQPVANDRGANGYKQAKTVAVGCDWLPKGAHGKRRVDATSLLLKRGSPSSLRKESRVPQTRRLAGLANDSNTSGAAVDDVSALFFVPGVCLS